MSYKLFLILLGCRPDNRLTEQHDVFFGVAQQLRDLLPSIKNSWKEGIKNLHLDAFIEAEVIDGYKVTIEKSKSSTEEESLLPKLFFINFGGYLLNEFEEFHKKIFIVANSQADALKKAKTHPFYINGRQMGKARSHIDDKLLLSLEAEDIINISDKLLADGFTLRFEKTSDLPDSPIHIGYFKLSEVAKEDFMQ